MARRVAVAASGGRDSTALLHATCRAAQALGLEVLALHVHHGLMPQADAWLAQVQRQCARWARAGMPVRFVAQRISTRPVRGDSIEAWARRVRYQALAQMATEQGAELVLLAHHRSDQAETFMLQALRGAGPAGLAAMPRQIERDGTVWCRPWLESPRTAIDNYVRRYRLLHVDDASNHDPRHARSRLRRDVWPIFTSAFPDAEVALVHAAARAQESAQCVHELAQQDQAACVDGVALHLPSWLALSQARRANVLRYWLAARLAGGVPDSLVERLVRELPRAHTGNAWPTGGGLLRLHRMRLRHVDATPQPVAVARAVDLSAPGVYEFPEWGGAIVVSGQHRGGVPAALIAHATIGPREGGEQFQHAPKSTPRSLKKAFQAAGLGIDDRVGPLVLAHGQIVYVPGLGLDARAAARPGEPRRQLAWRSMLHRSS